MYATSSITSITCCAVTFVPAVTSISIPFTRFNTNVAPNTSIAPIISIPVLFFMSAFWSAYANIYLKPATTTAPIAKV